MPAHKTEKKKKKRGGIYTLQQVEGDSNNWCFCFKIIRTNVVPRTDNYDNQHFVHTIGNLV